MRQLSVTDEVEQSVRRAALVVPCSQSNSPDGAEGRLHLDERELFESRLLEP